MQSLCRCVVVVGPSPSTAFLPIKCCGNLTLQAMSGKPHPLRSWVAIGRLIRGVVEGNVAQRRGNSIAYLDIFFFSCECEVPLLSVPPRLVLSRPLSPRQTRSH